MPYSRLIWTNEIPTVTPIKYKITQTTDGDVAANAEIEIVTPVTAGTPVNAANLNHLEDGVEEANNNADAAAIAAAAASADAATALAAALAAGGIALGDVYPIGCIYTTVIATNPNAIFGFGTWVSVGAGRVLVGFDSGQTEFDTVEETGGEKTHDG